MIKKILLITAILTLPLHTANPQAKQKNTKITQYNKILTLDKCLYLVLNKNDEYKSYNYKLMAKKDKINEAKAALYYPNISMGLTYTYHGTEPKTFIKPAPYKLTTSFDINKIIFNFGKFGALVSIAEQDYNITKLNKINTKNNIIKNVQTAFYKILLAKHNLSIIKNANKLLKETLIFQKNNYLSGRSSKSDYIRIQIQYQNDKINIAKAKDNLLKAINSLFTLLSIKPISKNENMNYEIKGNFNIEKQFLKYKPLFNNLGTVIAKARKNRLEIRKLKLQQNMLKLNKIVTSAAYKPVLSVFGTVNLDYLQQNKIIISPTSGASIGLGDYKLITDYIFGLKLSIPLSELFIPNSKSQSQENSLQSEIRAINKNIDALKTKIEEDVIQKYISYNETNGNIKIRKKIARLARENFFIARKAYLSSTIDYLDYLDANHQYRTSQFNYYNELYNHNIAYLDLLLASGIYY